MQKQKEAPHSFDRRAMWNLSEICNYLGICRRTFYNNVKGSFQTMKIGRGLMANAGDVMDYANRKLKGIG